eukprot:g37.t1
MLEAHRRQIRLRLAEEEAKRIREQNQLSKAEILRNRILSRRRTYRTSTALANAGLKTFAMTARRQGRKITKEDKIVSVKNRAMISNAQAKIKDAIIRNDVVSRGLVSCATQQLQMELLLKREAGIARPHIRAELSKASSLYERISRLRDTVRSSVSDNEGRYDNDATTNTKTDERKKKDSGVNRVANELSVVKKPVSLTCKCPHCGDEFVEGLLSAHIASCQLWQRGGSRSTKSTSHSQRLTRYLAENAPRICPHCAHRVPLNRYDKHVMTCKTIQEHSKMRIRLEAKRAGVDVDTGCRRPGVPTRLVATPIAADKLRVTWTRPIFDGGFDVQEYVLEYRLRKEHRIGKRKWYTFGEPIEVRTSQWCLLNPVAHEGIVLHGLRANQSYAKFSVRAWNEMGYSERSEEVDFVTMPDPTAPSAPKHLTIVRAYSESIRLRWALPHSTGGMRLTFAEIEYQSYEWKDLTNQRSEQTLNTMYGSEGGRAWKTHSIHVKDDVQAFSIRNLAGDTEYRNIRIRISNEAGLRSPWSDVIESVTTPPATKLQDIVDELARAHAMQHDFVDSSFFRQEYPQRYTREAYVELLHDELKIVVAERYKSFQPEAEIVDALERRGLSVQAVSAFAESVPTSIWIYCRKLHPAHVLLALSRSPHPNGRYRCDKCGQRKKNVADYACVICGLDFCKECVSAADATLLASSHAKPALLCGADHRRDQSMTTVATTAEAVDDEGDSAYKLRKKQFIFRINKIESSIRNAKETIDRSVREQSHLESENKFVHDDVRDIKLELERVQITNAEYVDTSIAHGEPQRYGRDRLIRILKERLAMFQSGIIQRTQKILSLQRTISECEMKSIALAQDLRERRAALMAFEKEKMRLDRAKRVMARAGTSAMPRAFDTWAQAVREIRRQREICRLCFARIIQYKKFTAFQTWKDLVLSVGHMIHSTKKVTGIGSRMLVKSSHQRQELRDSLQSTLSSLAELKHNIHLADMSANQINRLHSSSLFERTDTSRMMDNADPKSAEAYLAQADGYLNMKECNKAVRLLEFAVRKFRARGDPAGMGAAYGRMGRAMRMMGNTQKSLLCYQRQANLAKEADDVEGQAVAAMHMGEIHVELGQLRHGLHEVEQSVSGWLKLRDSRREAIAYRTLAKIHRLMNEESSGLSAEKYEKMAVDIETTVTAKLTSGIDVTDKIIRRMVGVQAEQAEVIRLQQCTAALPKLRRKHLLLSRKRDALLIEKRETHRRKPKLQKHMKYCRDRLGKALNSEYTEMDSDFLHKGLFQRFKVSELVDTIEKEIGKTQKELDDIDRTYRKHEVNISNCEDDMRELTRYIKIEESSLIQKVLDKRLYRDIALNTSNMDAYDVSGGSTGGVQSVVAAVRKSIMVFELHTGKCVNMFGADDESSHVGESRGHTRQITCLFFREENVYSGSVDCDVRVWHIDRDECVARLQGHRGSVWAVHATFDRIISAAADREIRIWGCERDNWDCLKIIARGHSKTVRAIQGNSSEFVTGGADGRVILWEIQASERHRVHKVRTKCKLLGHGCSISCVSWSKTNLMSGDVKGTIIVWDTRGRSILRRLAGGHRGAVTMIQFDETKIVSTGKDHNVVIHDIASGRCLVTLHGHSDIVKALQFDKDTILTASFDGTIRRWPIHASANVQENEKATASKPRAKYHIAESSDTVLSLSKKFGVSASMLRYWNDITDTQDIWTGQRIIVRVEDGRGNVLEGAKMENLHKPKGQR